MVRSTFRRLAVAGVAFTLSIIPAGQSAASQAGPALSATASVTPAQLGLAVLSETAITQPNGSRISLTLPRDHMAGNAIQVPSGWVVWAFTKTGDTSLWLFPVQGGTGRLILSKTLNWTPSPDGRSIAIAPLDKSNLVHVYALPSLRKLASHRFASSPWIVGFALNRVTVAGPAGAIWNVGTGAVTSLPASVFAMSVSDTGLALTRTDRPAPAAPCLNAVSILVPTSIRGAGACSALAREIRGGTISPDGQWAMLLHGKDKAWRNHVARVSDLQAGRWQPITLPSQVGIAHFWDTSRTVIHFSQDLRQQWRCDIAGRCTQILLPGQGLTTLIPRLPR